MTNITNPKDTSYKDDLDDDLLEFNVGDSVDPEPEEVSKVVNKKEPPKYPLDLEQDPGTSNSEAPPAYSVRPESVQKPTPQEEHSIRLQRKAESEKTTPLVSGGYNHNKSSSIDGPVQNANRGLSGGAFGMSQDTAEEIQPTTVLPDEDEWQKMPTVASYDVYDDKGHKVVVRHDDFEATQMADNLDDVEAGGSKYGYTRVTLDDDVKSVTSMDENTDYLFDQDEFNRSPLAQLNTTKDMLTDGQKIAYVGLCKLAMVDLANEVSNLKGSRRIRKKLSNANAGMSKWAQMMTMRLYSHMDVSPEEQLMIEQLSLHGVLPSDLAPSLMKFAKVKNPLATADEEGDLPSNVSTTTLDVSQTSQDSLHVETPEKYAHQDMVDIDIRWTLLCDLFLVLISDSTYDARSRTLLEHVGKCLSVSKLDITKFEEKVTNALEIEEASQQTWKETEIMEDRRKKSLRKKYMYVGMATLGGGLVLGLSAGLLAPVIGAGLAAGFTTIGITGTSGFLAGAGGAAIVTTTGAVMGVKIGSTGMNNRMGHVRTFEFRPLHNHKRVNLIVTVSGWMSGKEDDVRLPFSTVDPIMGDLYSLLWEPEMLRSMGQTINILATEVLTQSIQQVLGSTILVALMSSIQLPMALAKLGYLLDNPWNVSLDRAWSSGLILADTLVKRNLGVRPVTLVGFSLGARVIYSCLVELARQGAYGLVQDVYIFGAPVVAKRDQFVLARSVVHGRFVNGYSRKDWILGYLFRATSGGLGRVSGLAAVENVAGLENFDNTEYVDGHMGYRKAMPQLLSLLGWEVLSEDFAEIEDPDPEQHRERQRQLIEEFDVARKQMEQEQAEAAASAKEKKGKKRSMFSWMKPRSNANDKQLWEMYDRELEARHKEKETNATAEDNSDHADGVLFDVNAIKENIVELSQDQPKGNVSYEEYIPVQAPPAPQYSPASTKSRFSEKEIEISFDPFEDDALDRRGGIAASSAPDLSTTTHVESLRQPSQHSSHPTPLHSPMQSQPQSPQIVSLNAPKAALSSPKSRQFQRSFSNLSVGAASVSSLPYKHDKYNSSNTSMSGSLNGVAAAGGTTNSTTASLGYHKRSSEDSGGKHSTSMSTVSNKSPSPPAPPPKPVSSSGGIVMTFDDDF